MATAEEILAEAFESEAITVNVETRELMLPRTLDHIGVMSDDDVLTIPFILPRFYCGVDFKEFDININYLNANGEGDVYHVLDAVVEHDTIKFSWLVGRYAVAYAGNATFNLCLKKYRADGSGIVEKEWNSIPTIIKVNEGLETIEAAMAQQPELIGQLCGFINTLTERVVRIEKLVGLGDNYGYSKIQFIDGVIIISPGGPGGSGDDSGGSSGSGGSGESGGGTGGDTGDVTTGYTLAIRNSSGKTIRIYRNSYDITSLIQADQLISFKEVERFLCTDNSVVCTFTNASGEAVSIVPDAEGWYTLTQDVAANVITTPGVSGHTLYITSDTSGAVYINNDITVPISFNIGNTMIYNVSTFKLVAPENFNYNGFIAGSPLGGGSSLSLTPDVNGWYTLTQDTTADIKYKQTETTKTITGKWIFDENITFPEDMINISGYEFFTGTDYGTVFHELYAYKDSGVHYVDTDSLITTEVVSPSGEWTDMKYRYVDFGTDGAIVSDEVYNWLVSNAVPGEFAGWSITNNLTGCSTTNSATTWKSGARYVSKITPDDSAVVVTNVKVTMGGVDVTNEVYWEGEIVIAEVTGDIVITAIAGEYEYWPITLDLTSSSCSRSFIDIQAGSSYSNTVYPNDGFTIDSVSVTMDGVDITDKVYSYDAENDRGNISIACVTGPIVITAVSVANSVYRLTGKWIFNESVVIPSSMSSELYGYTGKNYTLEFRLILAFATGLFYRIDGKNVNVAPATMDPGTSQYIGVFSDANYRRVDFGLNLQIVGEDFYHWFLANAVSEGGTASDGT